MTIIKNTALAGEQLTTQYGVFTFNSEGIVDVPDELAQKLASIKGFVIIGKVEDNPGDDTPSGGDVTLEGGVVWHKIEGGYIVSNDAITFTLTGSGVDSDTIPPVNVTLQNGALAFSANTDVANLHVKGVVAGESIQIGDNTYTWENLDGNSDNGYELKIVEPTRPLPGGGTYYPIEIGYVVSDPEATFTLTGDSFDFDHISVQNGKLVLQEGIDITNLHVLGVERGTSIQIGGDTYRWVDVDSNPSNGFELEYVPEIHTLEGGGNYTTLPGGGYELFDDTSSYSFVGGDMDVNHISVQDGKLVLSEGIDTSSVHIIGVNAQDTLQIGEDTYRWVDVDDNPSNGLELEYIGKFVDLPEGGKYAIIDGKFVVTDGKETFTLILGTVDINDIGVKNGKLVILPGIDIDSIHAVGVTSGDTIQIGNDVYRWTDTDTNSEGYELVLVPKTNWEKNNGSVIYQNGETSYTLYGSAVEFDSIQNVPLNVSVVGGKLEFDPNISVGDIHVIGVEENSTIKIGENYYKWSNVDNDATNGLELTVLEEPEIFEYDFDGKKFTVEGGINSDVTVEQLNEGVDFDENGKLIIGKDIITSVDGFHIQGLKSGSVVDVNGEDYTLMDTDNNLDNGYELVGGTDDAFDWKWSNRNKPAEPQIWRHYTNNTPDIKVQGVSARPVYNLQTHTLTLLGDEINSITNSTNVELTLAGHALGKLSAGSMFSLKNGLVSDNANSYEAGNLISPYPTKNLP